MEDDQLPKTYERIIAYHYDSGDATTAAEWCERAVEGGVEIWFGRDDLGDVLAAAELAVEARRAEVEAAKRAEEQRLAEERERNKPNRAEMDQFYESVWTVDRHHVIAELDSNSLRTLTITVNGQWDALPHATRLEYARTFRGAWRGVWPCRPSVAFG